MFDLRIDKFYGLCFELVRTVQISKDEDLSGVLYREVCAQGFLAHHFQPFQSVLKANKSVLLI